MAKPSKPTITLDLADPSVAEAFESYEKGETFKIVSKDDNEVVLECTSAQAEPEGDEAETDTTEEAPEETPAPTSKNPAVSKLMSKYA